MFFKDIKQNYPVYILNKQDVTLISGKVISKSLPHISLNPQKTLTPTEMVIDITVDVDGKTATYEIPENVAVTFAGNTVIATEKQCLSGEIEAMKSTAEQTLASVEHQTKVLEKTRTLLEEVNPVYREKQETEKRFSKIESTVEDMKAMLSNFIKDFRS